MHNQKTTDNSTLSKVETNKNDKLNRLLDTAFKLFTEKGINHTSIQDIVNQAGVAKGTFYLYFKNKYEIQDHLLARTSYRLFHEALEASKEQHMARLDDEIIFIIDYIIDYLVQNPQVINFIKKNLSLGLYREKISVLMDDKDLALNDLFLSEVKTRHLDLPNPEVTLFMIIELVGSTVFSSIVKKEPLPIDEYKPILYQTIKMMINEN